MGYCEREVKPPILTTTLSRNANSALWSRQSEYRLSAVTIVRYVISPLPVEVYCNSYTATTLPGSALSWHLEVYSNFAYDEVEC